MKAQADKGRSERSFEVGDMVYLKLQPHIQTSIAPRSSTKLSFKFYGPFRVLQKIGAVAYKSDLPPSSQIHPVIHVSQLKKHVPPQVEVRSDLSSICTDPSAVWEPAQVLEKNLVPSAGATAPRIRVLWCSGDKSLVTSEDEQDLKRRLPEASAWGQAAFKGGRNVMNQRSAVKRLQGVWAEGQTTSEMGRKGCACVGPLRGCRG
jgi:hypothetical protein